MIGKSLCAAAWTLSLTCLVFAIVPARESQRATRPPLLTFADLKRDDLAGTPFRIEGYVTQVYKCPPCPAGAMCKPCIGDHFVLTNKLHEEDPALIKRLRVFTSETRGFEVGKKYLITVKQRGKKAPDKPVDEVDLIPRDPSEV